MGTSTATANLHPQAAMGSTAGYSIPDGFEPDQTRVLRSATRWSGGLVCAVVSHRWQPAPWSRWAFGWDRELTCGRCGQMRHERAKLHSDMDDEDDR